VYGTVVLVVSEFFLDGRRVGEWRDEELTVEETIQKHKATAPVKRVTGVNEDFLRGWEERSGGKSECQRRDVLSEGDVRFFDVD
jgi:hypothetical protein